MNSLTFISILILIPTLLLHADAIRSTSKTHNCPFTVWPAVLPHSSGRRLDSGQTWTLDYQDGLRLAKIWARTNCTCDTSGRSSCLTGDCGRQLNCTLYGSPSHTKAKYGLNSFGRQDYYDVSVMDGYNVVVESSPTTNGCTPSAKYAAPDIVEQCPV